MRRSFTRYDTCTHSDFATRAPGFHSETDESLLRRILRIVPISSLAQEEPSMSIPNPARTLAALLTTLALCNAAAAQKGKPEPAAAKPLDRPALALRLSGPYTHENLSVFLIHGE